MLAAIRSGAFATAERIRRFSLILLAFYAISIVALFATSPDGMRDFKGRPLGSDFFSFWTAGVMAARGDALDAYDPHLNYIEQQRLLGVEEPPYLPFLHPPQFLLATTPLGALPYIPAWVLFVLLSGGALLAILSRIAPQRLALLAAVAAPAFFLNVTHGQTGLLIAALFGAGAVFLDRRPILAGVAFGLLAIKPHYGVLIPLALAATGRWRAFIAAGAAVAAQAALASLVYGTGVWTAFLEKATFARKVVLEAGGAKWAKNDTLFSALRSFGVESAPAYAMQALFAAAVAASLFLLWRSRADQRLKSAGLITGALLVSPYALDYDLALLLPAMALLVAHGLEKGFAPYEKTAIAFAWAAPLFAFQIAALTLAPVGFLSIAGLYAVVLSRAGPLRAGAAARPVAA